MNECMNQGPLVWMHIYIKISNVCTYVYCLVTTHMLSIFLTGMIFYFWTHKANQSFWWVHLAFFLWHLFILTYDKASFVMRMIFSLKVRQSRNDFFKPTFLPKNERTNSTLLLWNLRLTCFHSFFGRNWRHQKDISKLTDL